MAKPVRPAALLPICLLLAWLFDFLFWGKAVGVSFSVFVLLLIGGGLWLAQRSGLKPARESWWLILLIVLLSLVSVFRAEPFTLFTSRLLTVVLLGLLALTLLGGRWVRYGFADHIVKLLALIPRGFGLLRNTGVKKGAPKDKPSIWRGLAPVARGLLLVMPLLLFLSLLLSSADPYFADWLSDLFFNFEKAPEYVLRGLVIIGLAYCLGAAYLYALGRSQDTSLLADGKPLLAPFLGFGEAATMLTSVDLLFAIFVAVQFRYFFGGLANIVDSPTGLTYAEYARRGFFELIVVAITALIFFVLLSSLTGRKKGSQQTWFSGLGIGLFVLGAVILVSAFQRLLLLEQVYGFTRLRTYPHVFMVWLGILLLAVVILEYLGRQRIFALAVLLAVTGFTLSLALLNVDSFIARVNLQRQTLAGELDTFYLATLSDDAIPQLTSAYQQAVDSGDAGLAGQLAISLACHFDELPPAAVVTWQSWTWSRDQAAKLWAQLNSTRAFPVDQAVECENPVFEAEYP